MPLVPGASISDVFGSVSSLAVLGSLAETLSASVVVVVVVLVESGLGVSSAGAGVSSDVVESGSFPLLVSFS